MTLRQARRQGWKFAAITLALAAGTAGCGDDEDSDLTADTEGASDSEGVDARVSYYDDVRPVLTEHCVACHTDGSIAPFALDSYESVAAVAPLVKAVIEARTMPPFAVRADGSCQEWDEPRWLTDSEVETIGAWVDGGLQAGDETIAAPPIPTLPALEGYEVGEVGIPQYEPVGNSDAGLEVDDYQCFLIELDLDKDRYLVGYDVQADNDAIVHHVLGFRVDPTFLGNGETMAHLDEMTPEPGWDCYGAAGEGVLPQGVPVTWAPGQGATGFPGGTGVRFAPGDVLVVQMHYNLLDEQGVDATKLNLQWADEVEREGFQVLWDPFLFQSFNGGGDASLPPGQPSALYEWSASFKEMLSFAGLEFENIDVWGLIPHMHGRGKAMSIDVNRAGEAECAADVDRYDYNWQRTYFYREPINVTMDDTMDVVCDFDTSNTTSPVKAGFGTQEEMCLVGVYFAPGE